MRIRQLIIMALAVLSLSVTGINNAQAQSVNWWNQGLDDFLDDYLGSFDSRSEDPSLVNFHNYLNQFIAYANGVTEAAKTATIDDVDALVEAYQNLLIEEAYITRNLVWATDQESIELARKAREASTEAKKAIKSRLLFLGVSLEVLPDEVKFDPSPFIENRGGDRR